MNIRRWALVLAGLGAAMPAAAFEPGVGVGASKFTIGIEGFVPVICRANVDATSVSPDAGVAQLGTLREFCNSPGGYRVMADYSPSLASAKLLVDGREVSLDEAGTTVISQSDEAAIDNHALAIAIPEGVQDGTISFRIEAL
mgnify:CR=1 FL=1